MAGKMFDVRIDNQQVSKLKMKLEKYPPFAIEQGLENVNQFLNSDPFKQSMYPESKSGDPFVWSSEKQRRAFFASDGFGRGIPTKRTYELANSGGFTVEKKFQSLYIVYQNTAPYFKWVQGQFSQIIGHIIRGWKPANRFVVDANPIIMERFRDGIRKAWAEMDRFIYGGGAGL